METKTCSITEGEIIALISYYAKELSESYEEKFIDRINYLNKRLNAEKKEPKPEMPPAPTEQKASTGW